MIRYVIMNTMRKLFALAILAFIPVMAAVDDHTIRKERKADAKARESYRKELRKQRHAAALEQSREHRNLARERNRERKAYAKEARRGHRNSY